MAINFPASPTTGQVFEVTGGPTWQYSGTAWNLLRAVTDDGAAIVTYTPEGTGAVTTTVKAKLDETVSVKDFGAVGDGVTNDDAALDLAVTNDAATYVPAGTYPTTNFSSQLVGKWHGEGQIKESGVGNHAPNLVIANAEPSPRGTTAEHADISTAFDGDHSKALQPVELRVLGANTLGDPTTDVPLRTGFHFCEELFPYYTHILNQGGFNYDDDDADGRSSVGAIRVVGTHNGQGGVLPISTSVWANQTRAGSTTFLANPAAAGLNASTTAGADGVFLNPIEVVCDDLSFDVAAMGYVASLTRNHDNAAPPLDCIWQGVRVQSKGAYPIDTVYTGAGVGGATTFIDATPMTLDANGELLLMKDGHRIYGNATFVGGTSIWKRATRGTDWLGYNSTITGWEFYVGGTEILRVRDTGIVVTGTGSATLSNGNLILGNSANQVRIGGNKILGAQEAAVADATDAASAITQLNALLARLRTHGVIAT